MNRSALIVDSGWTRAALAATRALGAAGWRVGVAAPTVGGLAASSTTVSARHLVPPISADSERWSSAVNRAIASHGYELVLPAGDAELLVLSALRDGIAARVPYPRHEIVVRAVDKLALFEAGGRAGLRVPETAELTDERLRDWSFPAMVKARMHHAVGESRGSGRQLTTVAADRDEALRAGEQIRATGGTPIIQEIVSGRLLAYTTVTDQAGECVASVTQVASRTWPLAAGVSARAVTIAEDPALTRRVLGLLRELEWNGLAQLQFLTGEDGEPRLIDLNARFYGSLALALASGVNLPAAWAATALGDPHPAGLRGRAGVRYQWLEGDLRGAAASRGGLVRGLAGCALFSRGATPSIWDWRDPAPALASWAHFGRRAGGTLLRVAPGRG